MAPGFKSRLVKRRVAAASARRVSFSVILLYRMSRLSVLILISGRWLMSEEERAVLIWMKGVDKLRVAGPLAECRLRSLTDNPLSLLNLAVFMTRVVFGFSKLISERSIFRSDQVKNLSAEARLAACRLLIMKWTVLLAEWRSKDRLSANSRAMRIVGRGAAGAGVELLGAAAMVAAEVSAGRVWMARWLA